MEIKELRIGNLISDGYYGFMKVAVIDDSNLIALRPIGFVTKSNRIEAGELNPIPLTENWLILLGFKRSQIDKNEWTISKSWFTVRKADNVFKLSSNDSNFNEPCILHVHELQNLYFALTKKELYT